MLLQEQRRTKPGWCNSGCKCQFCTSLSVFLRMQRTVKGPAITSLCCALRTFVAEQPQPSPPGSVSPALTHQHQHSRMEQAYPGEDSHAYVLGKNVMPSCQLDFCRFICKPRIMALAPACPVKLCQTLMPPQAPIPDEMSHIHLRHASCSVTLAG